VAPGRSVAMGAGDSVFVSTNMAGTRVEIEVIAFKP
jgi:hypothetical protein